MIITKVYNYNYDEIYLEGAFNQTVDFNFCTKVGTCNTTADNVRKQLRLYNGILYEFFNGGRDDCNVLTIKSMCFNYENLLDRNIYDEFNVKNIVSFDIECRRYSDSPIITINSCTDIKILEERHIDGFMKNCFQLVREKYGEVFL
jgi:uncharacterized secreted protein with C-terminal beta-propeller domain